MSRWITIAIALWMLQSTSVSAQYIGIFMDPNATSCAAEVGPAPWIDLHVVAVLEGDVTEMFGAQFQITGAPAAWTPDTVLWVPDPNLAISLGHPVFPNPIHEETPGVNVTFSSCQQSSASRQVPLGRVILLGAPTAENVHLRVEGFKLVPPDPDCPFVNACNEPDFSKVCVGGGEVVLNGPGPASCQLAVEARTWSGVKALYKEL